MPRLVLLPALAVLVLGLVAGCDSDGETLTATSPGASPSPTVSDTAAPTPTPTPSATSTPTPTPTPSATAGPTAKPTKVSTTAPTPSPSADALASIKADVESVAPQLESYYRDREYPVDLAQVRQTLDGAGVTLSPGNRIGGYVLDGDAVEFTLCIENASGAWASYDTAPMSLRESGASGGCP